MQGSLIQSDEAEQDAWGIEREPVQQNEDAAPMSIRQRIRLMGKAALAQKAKVVAAPPPKASIKGLKRHIHYEYYEHLRNINKQTCFNALLSLVLAVTSVTLLPVNPTLVFVCRTKYIGVRQK